jgi:hypothetical protein
MLADFSDSTAVDKLRGVNDELISVVDPDLGQIFMARSDQDPDPDPRPDPAFLTCKNQMNLCNYIL